MDTTDKKGPKTFSLTFNEYKRIVERAHHHGMSTPSEYLLALLEFDKAIDLVCEWQIKKPTLQLPGYLMVAEKKGDDLTEEQIAEVRRRMQNKGVIYSSPPVKKHSK